MILHFVLFFSLVILSLFFNPTQGKDNRIYFFIIFLILFCISTFRRFDVGNDTLEYFRVFNLINRQNSLTSAFAVSRYEKGFVFLNYVIGKMNFGFTFLLGTVTSFYLFSVFRFINKYSNNIGLAVLLFFSFSMFYDVLNIMRQCISVGFFLFAIDYLIERKPLRYFAIVFLSILFQKISILLLFIYFIPKANFNKLQDIFKWIGLFVVGLISINYMSQLFISYFPYYGHYFKSMYSEGGIRTASIAIVLVRFVEIGLVALVGALKKDYKEFDNEVNVFFILLLMDLFCTLGAISFNLFDRVENFFTIGVVVILSNSIKFMSNSNKVAISVLSVLIPISYLTVTLITRQNWYGIFPYYFLWQ